MIDLHSHILPGLDDGVRSEAEAFELVRQAIDEGVTAMAATPHVGDRYPTTAEQMEAALAELREALRAAGLPLELLPGGEVTHERLASLGADEVRRFTLGGSGRYLLLEMPFEGWPLALDGAIYGLLERGLVPVLAHPERNTAVQERPARLEAAVADGALVQLTASSVVGALGRTAEKASRRLLKLGLVHLLSSDLHSPGTRSTLGAGAAAIGDAALSRYLTQDAPAAIVAGEPVPHPPSRGRTSRLGGLGRRAPKE